MAGTDTITVYQGEDRTLTFTHLDADGVGDVT